MAAEENSNAQWMPQSTLSFKKAALLTFALTSITYLAFKSSPGGVLSAYLESRLVLPINFTIRNSLGEAPSVDPALKIFSIDDKTLASLDSWALDYKVWQAIIEKVAEHKPRLIMIDAIFAKSEGFSGGFVPRNMIPEGVTVAVGSAIYPKEIGVAERPPMDLRQSYFNIDRHFSFSDSLFSPQEQDSPGSYASLLDALNIRTGTGVVYGPSEAASSLYNAVGHISYLGDGMFVPYYRFGDKILPHAALYASQNRVVSAEGLQLDGHILALDDNGRSIINFPDLNELRKRNRQLLSIINAIKNNESIKHINEGDIVLLLPLMFTGHADFATSPVGVIPGGYVQAAVLNSVLAGSWIKPLTHTGALTVLLALLVMIIALRFNTVAFWISTLSVFLGFWVGCQYLFAYQHIAVSWLIPLCNGMIVAGVLFAEKTRDSERKSHILRQAFQGAVEAKALARLAKRPEQINLEAREQVISIVFIDVVGFSLVAESLLPRAAFDHLKKLITAISEVVHKHNGIIDKTLGDGLLCYFGYSFDGRTSTSNHAEVALRCAAEIQAKNLAQNIANIASKEPIFPLRIGINTAPCYLGDIGSKDRIDFTLVGNGVNFAKRLEGACDVFSILIGRTTYDLVRNSTELNQNVSRKFIRIKHHTDLVEAYEVDPFYKVPELRSKAIEAFRKSVNLERVVERWGVPAKNGLQVKTDLGNAQVLNISLNGCSLSLGTPLGKGSRLRIWFDSVGGMLKQRLQENSNIFEVTGEVRWSYQDGQRFVHGVYLQNLSPDQARFLLDELKAFSIKEIEEKAS